MSSTIELSLVMPCLNEKSTIGRCVTNCKAALKKYGIKGEVIVCDNGSSDGSDKIAVGKGARVVYEKNKGYGNACIKGLRQARGKYLLKLDADGSYDPNEIDKFLVFLRHGYDVVMGSRIRGKILSGSMPWSHRYIGNPVLTLTANVLCLARVSDLCCGMKAFSKEAFKKMKLSAPGMEFGPETTVKARQTGVSLIEVPIVYHPDGRMRKSNLNQWRDGIRDLLFLFSQSVLFKNYKLTWWN